MTRLSVIVPCFNCADTLEQAVASIYRQDLQIPYDVTMVDDGSTDRTYEVMSRVAGEHSNIRIVRHASNRGGGAARNTAVANSRGDLLFCLDADDILGDGCLRAMTQSWQEKQCDGITLGRKISFRGGDVRTVEHVTEFPDSSKRIRFESFLEKRLCPVSIVFLITREAFGSIGGYPTQHGFDTQGLGFRFLCHDLTAFTCPGAIYYHRVSYHESYYLREQREDRLNWNWFSMLDEFLYLFSRDVQARLLASDLFRVPGRRQPSPINEIVQGHPDIYARNYRSLLRRGPQAAARLLAKSSDPRDQYWLGVYELSKGRPSRALERFKAALAQGFDYRIIHYRVLEASLRLSGSRIAPADVINELGLYCQPFPFERWPWRQRLVSRLLSNRMLQRPVGWLNARWVRIRDARGLRGL